MQVYSRSLARDIKRETFLLRRIFFFKLFSSCFYTIKKMKLFYQMKNIASRWKIILCFWNYIPIHADVRMKKSFQS